MTRCQPRDIKVREILSLTTFLRLFVDVRVHNDIARLLANTEPILPRQQCLKRSSKVPLLLHQLYDVHFLFKSLSGYLECALSPGGPATPLAASGHPGHEIVLEVGQTLLWEELRTLLTIIIIHLLLEQVHYHVVVERVEVPSRHDDCENGEENSGKPTDIGEQIENSIA